MISLTHYGTINDAAFPKAALYKRVVGGITWTFLLVEFQTTVQKREHMIAVLCKLLVGLRTDIKASGSIWKSDTIWLFCSSEA